MVFVTRVHEHKNEQENVGTRATTAALKAHALYSKEIPDHLFLLAPCDAHPQKRGTHHYK